MRTKLIFTLILLILVVIFALQNSNSVTVHFLFWESTLPVALIIVISLAAGGIIGLLYSIPGKKEKTKEKSKEKTPEKKDTEEEDKTGIF